MSASLYYDADCVGGAHRRTASLYYDADCVGGAHRRMRDIRRDKECFPFSDKMIDDLVALPDPDFDVALELIKIFLRIDEVKIVPRVWTLDHHHEEVAAIVEIFIADRWLEVSPVLLDPVFE